MYTKEMPKKEVIQSIVLSECGIQDGTDSLYYKSDKKISVSVDGAYKLEEKNDFDFFTFVNALSITNWKKYTMAENFYLELEARGSFDLELFGYYKTNNRYLKEWCGRYSYDFAERTKIVIPYPSNLFSSFVAFGLQAKKDVYVYHACYLTDSVEHHKREVNVCLYTVQGKELGQTRRNIGILEQELLSNPEYANSFQWYIYDSEKILSSVSNNNIKISAERMPQTIADINAPQMPTHILYLGSHVLVSGESIKRLYCFLGFLKSECGKHVIAGLSLDILKRNLQSGIYTVSKQALSAAQTQRLDMNLWYNILESEERLESLSPDEYTYAWSYLCRPVESLNYKITDGAICKKDDVRISMNSFAAWVEKEHEADELFGKLKEEEKILRIQNILMSTNNTPEVTRNMYYRSNADIWELENGTYRLADGVYYDFFTYFNALSYGKWSKFTSAKQLFLVLEIQGDFTIELFGHYKNNGGYEKEWFSRTSRNCEERQIVVFPFSKESKCAVVSYGIMANSNVEIFDAYYAAKVNEEDVRTVDIALVTTTFKREDYVRRNAELLMENLFSDQAFQDYFHWNIIDNGRTLEQEIANDHISIFQNPNLGGAGGFARGMYESLVQNRKYTHILFMDDDVMFIPESFKRLYVLLSLVKDEYKDYFISGAMLKMGQPNIQHEDVGLLNAMGYHEAAKPNLDLNLWNSIVDNESYTFENGHYYAAWWFCCIPVGTARLDNLPLPVFVRGDDVEYSLRNKARFITMNGLCIWHEGFEGKFSAAMEFYQVERNELVVASHGGLADVDVLGRIQKLFWEEMYKFNYKGASLLLDALDDYLKGPEYLFNLDGEKVMRETKARDNQLMPLTDEVKAKIDWDKLYVYETLPPKKKWIYDYTYNGQARIPQLLTKRKSIGVIPYGWGYFQSKMCMVKKIYAIDGQTQKYVVFEKDCKKFREVKNRYHTLMDKMQREGEGIRKAYQEAFSNVVKEENWKGCFGLAGEESK